jgi:uncharacterized protein YodC (DUF2158 family)
MSHAEQAFRIGDIVKLRSGGVPVTICSEPYYKGVVGNVPLMVKCQWMNKFGDLREAEFNIELIHHWYPPELRHKLRSVEQDNAA